MFYAGHATAPVFRNTIFLAKCGQRATTKRELPNVLQSKMAPRKHHQTLSRDVVHAISAYDY